MHVRLRSARAQVRMCAGPEVPLDEYGFPLSPHKRGHMTAQVMELPVDKIRRPLGKTRANDQAKVEWLAESIKEIGLQEPIDVIEVDGVYYGFSGCHRYEAHQRLGYATIKAKVRKGTKRTLLAHLK
jgi:sulfiredoxin